MSTLNYKHLRYFWMVAKSGSIVRAGEQLFLSPQSISGQLGELEASLGVQLFRRVGRGLELTEMGRRIYRYADEIFALGNELLDEIQNQPMKKSQPFRVGIAESVPKSLAYRVIEPALSIGDAVRLICREGTLPLLLTEMAVHKLDMVIADRAMPSNVNVKAYSHLLGETTLSVVGARQLGGDAPSDNLPALLHQAPFLMPGEDFAIHLKLLQWFEANHIFPRIVGEFDDSALLKAFGQGGAGFFVVPTAVVDHVCQQYEVVRFGCIETIKDQLYAITPDRRMTHPGVVAVAEATKQFLLSPE